MKCFRSFSSLYYYFFFFLSNFLFDFIYFCCFFFFFNNSLNILPTLLFMVDWEIRNTNPFLTSRTIISPHMILWNMYFCSISMTCFGCRQILLLLFLFQNKIISSSLVLRLMCVNMKPIVIKENRTLTCVIF